MYHATGPAVPMAARQRVEAHAAAHGWPLVVLDAGEQADERYRANPVDRCFYCKSNLYSRIAQTTGDTIASGTNRDDLGDYRPGLRAAAEHDVVHPYVEAGIGKDDVYALARALRPVRPRAPAGTTLSRQSRGNRHRDRAGGPRVRGSGRGTSRAILRPRVGGALPRHASRHRDRAGRAGRCGTARGGGRHRARGVPTRPAGRSPVCAPTRAAPRSCGSSMTEFRLDWQRHARTGTSEAVLCESKTVAQIEAIVAHARELDRRLLLTRLRPRQLRQLAAPVREALDYDDVSRTAIVGTLPPPRQAGRVAIVCAGTSDLTRGHRSGAHARLCRGDSHVVRRCRCRRPLAAHGTARRHPAPSRDRRRGRHGGRAVRRAHRPGRERRGGRAHLGGVRRRQGRPGGARRRARLLRIRTGGGEHRQRIRRGALRVAHTWRRAGGRSRGGSLRPRPCVRRSSRAPRRAFAPALPSERKRR